MLTKNVSPRIVAIVTVCILALVQFAYWRLLVYRETIAVPRQGGPPTGPPGKAALLGREDVAVETFVGETPGFADGPAWRARLCGPNAIAFGPDGNLLVSDSRNHRIRSITPVGTVSTVAGAGDPNGVGGCSDGPVTRAQFRYPSGLAVGKDGTIYVADTGNHRICRIHAGTVTTVAGGTAGSADGKGSAARFRCPAALTMDTQGTLWVADLGSGRVRRIEGDLVSSPTDVPGAVREALGMIGKAAFRPLLAWPPGEPDLVQSPYAVRNVSASAAAPAGTAPLRVTADLDRNTLLMRSGAGYGLLVGRVASEGTGIGDPRLDDGPGNRAQFARPAAVALAADGTVYVADYEGNRIRRVRLPAWLLRGEQSPPRAARRFRGRRDFGR